MCGICGIINFNNEEADVRSLHKMMQVMKHRGPDDEGVFVDGNTGLGFVRLSILDLSDAGHQPMCDKSGRYIIVFNGEIFNYIELKEELKSVYDFKTGTDTEVVLAAFKEWGEDCIHRFNGMWAFTIYDKQTKKIFISRDRFGIKPFYYYHDKNRFIFASDIPPILKVLETKPKANSQAVYDYLLFNRTNYSEQTFFENIFKLPHSHNIRFNNNSPEVYRWYNLKENIDEAFVSEDGFRSSLLLSIKQQLRSDVSVGICLSGGLDSTSILSLASKFTDIPAFSAVYEKGDKADESEYINEFKEVINNIEFTKPTGESLLNDLEDYIEAMVEPIPGTSEYAEFKVMQLAKKHCTVVLNGQGADEEMAGYLTFFGYYFKELFKQAKFRQLWKEIKAYKRTHKENTGIKWFLFLLLPVAFKDNSLLFRDSCLSKGFLSAHKASKNLTSNLYNSATLNEALINHFEYKFEHHLSWADRSGMWFSMETRFPFLDHRFAEKTLALPNEKKISKGITKKILRDSMKGILPEKIRMRMDKVGYETPEDNWFREPKLKAFIKDVLSSDSFRNRPFFNHKCLLDKINQHFEGKINIGKEIWKWIHLELWFRRWID